MTFFLLTIPMSVGILGLTLFFWLRVALSVLELKGGNVIAICLVAIAAEALLVGFIFVLLTASPE